MVKNAEDNVWSSALVQDTKFFHNPAQSQWIIDLYHSKPYPAFLSIISQLSRSQRNPSVKTPNCCIFAFSLHPICFYFPYPSPISTKSRAKNSKVKQGDSTFFLLLVILVFGKSQFRKKKYTHRLKRKCFRSARSYQIHLVLIIPLSLQVASLIYSQFCLGKIVVRQRFENSCTF